MRRCRRCAHAPEPAAASHLRLSDLLCKMAPQRARRAADHLRRLPPSTPGGWLVLHRAPRLQAECALAMGPHGFATLLPLLKW
jgi:hypothetical protein